MQQVAGTIARAVSDLAAWGAGVVAGEETRTACPLIVVDQCKYSLPYLLTYSTNAEKKERKTAALPLRWFFAYLARALM